MIATPASTASAPEAAANPTRFAHVVHMSDSIGMFEHADHTTPRRQHGYCTDDLARLLIVTTREPAGEAAVRDLRHIAFRFVATAQTGGGRVRNRRTVGGRWTDRSGVEDCWGRAMWAMGTAAAHAPEGWIRAGATTCFNRGAAQRSPHRRAMAFAALGAAELLTADAGHARARQLLADAIDAIGPAASSAAWPWPEPRLAYANAALPEALLVAGEALGRPDVVDEGLRLLDWLIARETCEGHLSPTPVGGAGIDDPAGRFDQQPIEVAALADAAGRAFSITGDERWRVVVEAAVAWFGGANDLGVAMWDAATGGGYDGLTATGPNLNQGAESTLALISTMQHAGVRRPRLTQPATPAR